MFYFRTSPGISDQRSEVSTYYNNGSHLVIRFVLVAWNIEILRFFTCLCLARCLPVSAVPIPPTVALARTNTTALALRVKMIQNGTHIDKTFHQKEKERKDRKKQNKKHFISCVQEYNT